jgi:hypothetical protein
MTPHADEHTLELLVLEPDRFQASDRAAILAHLGECPGCRAVHEDLMAVYAELRKEPGRPDAQLAVMMRRIFTPAPVIRLTPYHPHLQVPAGGSYSGILDAMAPETMSREGFETVATFASPVDHILLRVRQDASTRQVKLYYHADDPLCQLGPVVTLPALDADAVIDDHGRAEFQIEAPRSPRAWSQLEALVAFPVCTAVRDEDGVVRVDNTSGRMYDVTIGTHGGHLDMHCSGGPTAPDLRRAVIWSEAHQPVLVQLSSGHASFPDPASGKKLMIRLYT